MDTLELGILALTRLYVPGLVMMGNDLVTFWACCRFVGHLVIYQFSRAIFRNTTFWTTKSPIAVFCLLMPFESCHWGYWEGAYFTNNSTRMFGVVDLNCCKFCTGTRPLTTLHPFLYLSLEWSLVPDHHQPPYHHLHLPPFLSKSVNQQISN